MRTVPVLLPLAAVTVLLGCMCDAAPGDILVESKFLSGFEDWQVTSPAADFKVESAMKRVSAKDSGNQAWYFVAPNKFLGDQRAAYNGFLRFGLGHFSYDSGGQEPSPHDDVILESGKLKLGTKGIFRGFTPGQTYSVALSAQNWTNIRTSVQATNHELVKVLSKLTAVKIRGGYYKGQHEHTWLSHPMLSVGKDDARVAFPTAVTSPTTRRSSSCAAIGTHKVQLLSASPLGTTLSSPWTASMTFTNVPYTCGEATLTVRAKGDLAAPLGGNKFVKVYDEDGSMLGKLFMFATKLQDEFEDSIVIPRANMVRMSIDRSIVLKFAAEESDNFASSLVMNYASLEVPIGGCYVRTPLKWPGDEAKAPTQGEGFVREIQFASTPVPDDDGAFYLSTTGKLEHFSKHVNITTPGRTGRVVGTLYDESLGSGSTTTTITATDSVLVTKANLTHGRAGSPSSISMGVITSIDGPSTVKLEESRLMFPPETCYVYQLTSGLGLNDETFYREVNSSFSFSIPATATPAGDALLTIVADISGHDTSDKYLEVWAREQSKYFLGRVFNLDFTGHHKSQPYIDHITIPMADMPQYIADGVFEFDVKIDMERLARTITWPPGTGGTFNLPALNNDGVYQLKSITLSYATLPSTA